jgi:hypothetical protein
MEIIAVILRRYHSESTFYHLCVCTSKELNQLYHQETGQINRKKLFENLMSRSLYRIITIIDMKSFLKIYTLFPKGFIMLDYCLSCSNDNIQTIDDYVMSKKLFMLTYNKVSDINIDWTPWSNILISYLVTANSKDKILLLSKVEFKPIWDRYTEINQLEITWEWGTICGVPIEFITYISDNFPSLRDGMRKYKDIIFKICNSGLFDFLVDGNPLNAPLREAINRYRSDRKVIVDCLESYYHRDEDGFINYLYHNQMGNIYGDLQKIESLIPYFHNIRAAALFINCILSGKDSVNYEIKSTYEPFLGCSENLCNSINILIGLISKKKYNKDFNPFIRYIYENNYEVSLQYLLQHKSGFVVLLFIVRQYSNVARYCMALEGEYKHLPRIRRVIQWEKLI